MPTAIAAARKGPNLSAPEFREMKRTFALDRAAIDVEKRTVPLSFASEEPVPRWFGNEILSITPEACDMTRLNNGGAVLVNHDWDDQVGVVLEASIDAATKKARCVAKFSRGARGQEIFQDIIDGIRSLVSVGYIVRKMELQSVDGDVETYRVTEWQPFEVSVVAVPADTSVGVGRSNPKPEETIQSQNRAHAQLTTMSETTTAAPAANEVEVRTNATTAERNRVKAIRGAVSQLLARHIGNADTLNSLANRAIDEGMSEADFNRQALSTIATPEAAPAQVRAELGLSRKEQRRYSLLRAINLIANGRPLDGLEREASDAEAKRVGREASGFFVPAEVFASARQLIAQQRVMQAGVAADGGNLIATEIDFANMVSLLRNQTHVLDLGARVITGLVGDVSIPRVLTGSAVSWVAENGELAGSTATFGQIALKPRRVGASIPYSKQFLAQSGLDPEMFMRDDIFNALGVDLDRVAIAGNGAAEPLGILNLATGDRATSVTFGAAPTWAKVVSFETNVETANALGLGGGKYAYLTSPGVKGAWKTTSKVANTASFLWENGDIVNGYSARSTNQVPSNKVVFGQFGQIIYGEWAGLDVVVDPYTLATKHQVKVTLQKLVDMVVRQGKAFSVSTDAGNQ